MNHISRHKALAHLDRLAGWQHGGKPSPVTIEWDLANSCSLGCQSCHFAHTHTKGPWAGRLRVYPVGYEETGTLADQTVVRRALAEMASAGVQAVIWSGGGEPTLHPGLSEIVVAAAEQGLQQGMYTHGGHITPDSGAFLGQMLSWVVISLDAADAATYAHEKGVNPSRFHDACNGARYLNNGKAALGVSFLLHELNWKQAHRMLALSRSLGAWYTTFRPTIETQPNKPGQVSTDTTWVTDATRTLLDLAKEGDVECDVDRFRQYRDWQSHGYKTCHGIKLSAVVTPDGRMWVCPQRRGVPGSCLGDLRTERFADIWAKHPGQWTDFSGCRAMCRLHLTNQVLEPVFASYTHEAFV